MCQRVKIQWNVGHSRGDRLQRSTRELSREMEMSRQKSLKQRIEASEDRASVSDSGITRSRIRVKEEKRQ